MKKFFLCTLSFVTLSLIMASCGDGNEPNVNPSYENGVLPGKFSVSNSQYVQFSQGNLQYNALQQEWRFAENQWDTIGVGNKQIGKEDYDGWIDLFGWGTGTNPTEASDKDNVYTPFHEWGNNVISNGGTDLSRWKTLTSEQMLYLFRNRENAVSLFGFGSIEGVNGIILLPDDWKTSNAPDFKPILKSGYTWDGSKYLLSPNCFSANTLTASDWKQQYERFGAVFLPAGGVRWGHYMHKAAGKVCLYWCRDKEEGKYPRALGSDEEDLRPASYCSQCLGLSVRLVQYEDKIFPQGAIKGEFSVSDNKKVYFSKGNLQYQHYNQRWQFALYAWQVLGNDNKHIGEADYDGWIDLFGWGTGDDPTKSSENNADYAEFHEWGNHPIINGGNIANQWRTLDGDEWDYLFHRNNNASFACATVNGVQGLILLPDVWQQPANVPEFKATILNDDVTWNQPTYYFIIKENSNLNYNLNVYTDDEWLAMEATGAVFLPGAGLRRGLSVSSINVSGHYWSSSAPNETSAYRCGFATKRIATKYADANNRHNGSSVRLVQDVK